MTVNANPLPPSALERVLARDRHLTAVALAALVVLAWSYLLVSPWQMSDASTSNTPSMPGMPNMPGVPGMGGETGGSAQSLALTVLMWWTMMIGMMVPSAAPMILLFGSVHRRQLAAESPKLRVTLFTAGYLAMWGAFSVLAAGAQIALTRLALLEPVDLTVTAWLGALFVALAGVCQLTPLKDACLRRCRSPAEFLSSHWRRGNAGAFRMGVEHGVYCVGCCWLLMGLLFVVGVMNLVWVALIAAFVLIEKLVPHGETTAKINGVALLALALFLALNA
jgi:predicted metal-binding membrane protein